MAIVIGTTSISTPGSSPTQTWSHTCSGDNTVLLVSSYHNTNLDVVADVSYAGVPMTKIGTTSQGSNRISGWYLLNPASGTNNIVATVTGGGFTAHCAVLVSGVRQAAPTNTTTDHNDSSTTGLTVTQPTSMGAYSFLFAGNESGTEPVAGDDTTLVITGGNIAVQIFRSTNAATSNSASLTFSGTSAAYLAVMADFSPVSLITNSSKPTTSFINSDKVSIGETWDTIDTTWDTETRTWDAVSQLIGNSSRTSSSITNSSKP